MADTIAQFYTNDDPDSSIHELLAGSFRLKELGLVPQPFPTLNVMSDLYHDNSDNAACINALTDFSVGVPGSDGNNFSVIPTVDNPDMFQLENHLLPLLAFPNPDQDANEIFKELFRDKYGSVTGNFDLVISDFVELNGQRRIAEIRYIPSHTVYKKEKGSLWAARDGKGFTFFNDFMKFKEKDDLDSLYHSRVIYRHHNYQGVATIMPAVTEVKSQNEILDSIFHYAKNGFKGQLIYQDESTDNSETTEKQLKAMFRKLVQKTKQFGIFRVKGKGTWKEISQTIQAEVYSTVMKMSKNRILRVHQMPGKLLGELGSTGGFETIDDTRIYFAKKVKPSVVSFQRDLQRLLIRGGITDWKIKFNAIDLTSKSQDSATISNLMNSMKTGIDAGIVTKERAKVIFEDAIADLQFSDGEN